MIIKIITNKLRTNSLYIIWHTQQKYVMKVMYRGMQMYIGYCYNGSVSLSLKICFWWDLFRPNRVDEQIESLASDFRIKTVNWRERERLSTSISFHFQILLRTSNDGLLIIAWPIRSHIATLKAPWFATDYLLFITLLFWTLERKKLAYG